MESFVILLENGGNITAVFYRTMKRYSFQLQSMVCDGILSHLNICKTALGEYHATMREPHLHIMGSLTPTFNSRCPFCHCLTFRTCINVILLPGKTLILLAIAILEE